VLDVSPWAGLRLIEPATGGNRTRNVWLGELDGAPVAVRRSRRPDPSLAWELDLMARLDRAGFRVPTVIPSGDGRPSVGGVVVQRWLDGREPSIDDDWRAVAAELQKLHRVTIGWAQRPGCCIVTELRATRRSVDADLDRVPPEVADLALAVFDRVPSRVPAAVIHGDPGPANVRIADDGQVGLLDWDESRVDVVWHDLSNLGLQVLDTADHDAANRLSDAWEAVNAWQAEPAYARRRLARLAEGAAGDAAGRRPVTDSRDRPAGR
jgi:Ser/Thr protein kinase RdoA (MazF antagonist)